MPTTTGSGSIEPDPVAVKPFRSGLRELPLRFVCPRYQVL